MKSFRIFVLQLLLKSKTRVLIPPLVDFVSQNNHIKLWHSRSLKASVLYIHPTFSGSAAIILRITVSTWRTVNLRVESSCSAAAPGVGWGGKNQSHELPQQKHSDQLSSLMKDCKNKGKPLSVSEFRFISTATEESERRLQELMHRHRFTTGRLLKPPNNISSN